MREPKVVMQEPAALLAVLWTQQRLEDRFGGKPDHVAGRRCARERPAWRGLATVVLRRSAARRAVPSTEAC